MELDINFPLIDINYYPLIDVSAEGTAFRPMMAVNDEETVRKSHSIWLMEVITNSYRLCCTDEGYEKLGNTYSITCPCCGEELRQIAGSLNRNKQGLYICESCKR